MNPKRKEQLLEIAKQKITSEDPSHDFEHALRVLSNAEHIAKEEKADLDIIIPASLFHDIVNWPKNHPNAKLSSQQSAVVTKRILEEINYPQEKIEKVCYAISVCSFGKGIVPELLEAKILQDADGLEATGAIAIMRTFCTTGQLKRQFYHPIDPFCKKRSPDGIKYALDLFWERLLKIEKRVHTKTAKKIAKRRTKFLLSFLKELDQELKGN